MSNKEIIANNLLNAELGIDSACEMAQMPEVFSSESLELWVYGKEGSVPHFHFKNDAIKVEGCIKFLSPEYFPHANKTDTLSSRQRKALVEYLSQKSTDVPTLTNFQFMVILWNTNNRRYSIPADTQMPDYAKLS